MRDQGNRARRALALVLLLALSATSSTAVAADLHEARPAVTMSEQGPVLLFLLMVLLSTPRANSPDAASMLMATERSTTVQVGCAASSGC